MCEFWTGVGSDHRGMGRGCWIIGRVKLLTCHIGDCLLLYMYTYNNGLTMLKSINYYFNSSVRSSDLKIGCHLVQNASGIQQERPCNSRGTWAQRIPIKSNTKVYVQMKQLYVWRFENICKKTISTSFRTNSLGKY